MNEQFIYGLIVFLFLLWCIPSLILEGYMWRWHLIPRNRWRNLYLNVFIGSDERTLHDHPWWSRSICIWGGIEETAFLGNKGMAYHQTTRDIRPFTSLFRHQSFRHFLTLKSKFAVTLFATGPKIQDWYFYPEGELPIINHEHPQDAKAYRWNWLSMWYRRVES